MREHSEKIVRLLCLGLGALLLFQVTRLAVRRNPLAGLSIPALPTLSAAADAQGGKGTNAVSGQKGSRGTNAVPSKPEAKSGTNAVSGRETNALAAGSGLKRETNSTPEQVSQKPGSNSVELPVTAKAGTNAPGQEAGKGGSNAVAQADASKGGTNTTARTEPGGKGKSSGSRPDMAMGSRPGMGMKPVELSPAIQARVDRVVDSEILGPVMRPMPMGLLGIAGNVAFLRAPNGQTGLVKEGDELGGIKLLRIGINRVLVEKEGQKEELTIFSGLGGQSLLSK